MKREIKVGDLVLVKKANVTPELIGLKVRVTKIKDGEIYVAESRSCWSINKEGLELVDGETEY